VIDLLRAHARLGLEPFLRGGWQAVGWVLGESLISASTVLATMLLAVRFDHIAGWTSAELFFLVGFVLVVRGLAAIFSGRNVLLISRKIGRGQLDHILQQPVPLWKALAAEGFSPFDLAVTLVMGFGVLIWSINALDVVTPLWIVVLLLNLGAGSLVIVSYQYLWGSLAFFAPRGAEEINTPTLGVVSSLSAFPLDLAPRVVLVALTTVVPVAFVGWVPSRALVDGSAGAGQLMLTPLFAAAFAVVAALVFRKGLRRYGRQGVGRYSDFGHRR
jgi:ABC-type uncharacterized transport system permease subunit